MSIKETRYVWCWLKIYGILMTLQIYNIGINISAKSIIKWMLPMWSKVDENMTIQERSGMDVFLMIVEKYKKKWFVKIRNSLGTNIVMPFNSRHAIIPSKTTSVVLCTQTIKNCNMGYYFTAWNFFQANKNNAHILFF